MIWTYHRFDAEADWLAAAAASDLSRAEVDVIGEHGGAWYVNAAWPGAVPAAMQASRIYPAQPLRQFAGAPDPTAPAPPAAVPDEVTNAQLRAALWRLGLHDEVHAALQAAGGEAWLLWEYANVVSRGGVLVAAFVAELGRTQAEVDDAFRLAATITG